jgi:hypothetical protein
VERTTEARDKQNEPWIVRSTALAHASTGTPNTCAAGLYGTQTRKIAPQLVWRITVELRSDSRM